MKPTAISLFSGIGGLDLAFSVAGFDIVAQVEVDPFCRAVLEKHQDDYWRNTTIFADVRSVTGRIGRGWRKYNKLPYADVIFGGFPCQDISISGQTAGVEEGTRSGLWFEFARLIGEIRPKMFLLENVPNIRNVGGTTVAGSIAALGYDARWGVISANDAGFPHLRKRWFCVGFASSNGRNRTEVATTGENRTHQQQNTTSEIQERLHKFSEAQPTGEIVGNTNNSRSQGSLQPRSFPRQLSNAEMGKKPTHESGLGGILDGFPDWMVRPQQVAGYQAEQHDWEPPRLIPTGTRKQESIRKQRIKGLGNAVVPQVAFPLAIMIKNYLEQLPMFETI